MIKIAALNQESEDYNVNEEEVTKEALEQIALQQYAKALDLHRKGDVKNAINLLKELLETEILYDVKKPQAGEKISSPLFHLKYLCFKNLGAFLADSDIEAAINYYSAATELDSADVSLWFRLGQLCMTAKNYEHALNAFQSGTDKNPHHWPCIDKCITLLLGLDHNEECISTIYDALALDPFYLRGLVYRRHIYTVYPSLKKYMVYLNPNYEWNKSNDNEIDENKAIELLKEAEEIHKVYLEQSKCEQFGYKLLNLKLKKPITSLSWSSVGESLIHMHKYMTNNSFSHSFFIEIAFEKEDKEKNMEINEEADSENKKDELVADNERNTDALTDNENCEMSDKEKPTTDIEKIESDVEILNADQISDAILDTNSHKKAQARRRSNAIAFLRQWEWCKKRQSGRKKAVSKQDDNIYVILRKMVPKCLTYEYIEKKQSKNDVVSLDLTDLDKIFDEKTTLEEPEERLYFGTDIEEKDVKDFILKYTENKRDIIEILKDYLNILADKWCVKWPEELGHIFAEANSCYNIHIDVPSFSDDNLDLLHYTKVNLLSEEMSVNKKLNDNSNLDKSHSISTIESVYMILSLKPYLFNSKDCLEFTLRSLWVKLHIHLINRMEQYALDCLYHLLFEFESMGEYHDSYKLCLTNFTFKPMIEEKEIMSYIEFLERNKRLSTVMDLYNRACYDELLTIILESFKHHTDELNNKKEEMSLDLAMQMSLILDSFWAVGKVEDCFKWSFICLHESLKHYFRHTSESPEYKKWTKALIKILCCMEHILTVEGLLCLDYISDIDLSKGLEDLIRIVGHQVETKASEMPIETMSPWIIIHYILQREEDIGRSNTNYEKDKDDEIQNSFMVLFIAHEQLGNRGWCGKSDGKLLFFILDTVVPRLRSPNLSKCLEHICQHLEQVVYCLYGHPLKKNKLRYLADHNATPILLNWSRAQHVYEIYRPPSLPGLEGKISGITVDIEQLFHRILALLPSECDPHKYVHEVEKYIKGVQNKLPSLQTSLLPFKMRDIYFLLGDYYFKKDENKMAVKYNMLDIVLNNNRLEAWAEISLAKAVVLERNLNSCKNIKNDKDFLNPAKSIIRCFTKALEIDPSYFNLWIEYGMFAYVVHSFCSRLLKQASESLSMEDFDQLEKQKEKMLDTTSKCFTVVSEGMDISSESEKEDAWLQYYMLGKVAEKRKKTPSIYLNYYLKSVKCLQETSATYPTKINYNSPTHLSMEVMELHYRIHASILKYIEQHENRPIPNAIGKVFIKTIEEWKRGPYGKMKKEPENEIDKSKDPIQAGNILKRSVSDAGEEENNETKKIRLENAAAKVRRSVSCEAERFAQKTDLLSDPLPDTKAVEENTIAPANKDTSSVTQKDADNKNDSSSTSSSSSSDSSSDETSSDTDSSSESSKSNSKMLSEEMIMKITSSCLDALEDCASRFPQHYKAIYRLVHYHFYYKKGKDIERCRDLMLFNFTSRCGQKLAGLFSERKHTNFFNNIWKIPLSEVDRAGGFAFHMNRSVLLTLEILKEIDDHKSLLDLSLYLNRIPEPDKKYLRDSDREELAQQAFSLCVQSLKGQVTKFMHQADLKSNEVERQALKSLMLDIYRAYQRVQKQSCSKQLVNLLIEAYKLICTAPLTDDMNLVDLSMKYCQAVIQSQKQQASQASLDKSQNIHKKTVTKTAEVIKPNISVSTTNQSKVETKTVTTTSAASSSSLPKMSQQDMATAFQSLLPMINEQLISQQATALSLSYLSNISALAGYASLPNLQSPFQNTFQAEFYRQFLTQNMSYNTGMKKQKRQNKSQPKTNTAMSSLQRLKASSVSNPAINKPISTVTTSSSSINKPNTVAGSNFAVNKSASLTGSSFANYKATTLASNITINKTTTSTVSNLAANKAITTAGSNFAMSKQISTPQSNFPLNKPSNVANLQKSSSLPMTPSMGTVLSSLPASMAASLSSLGGSNMPHPTSIHPAPTNSGSSVTIQTSPTKTLQEKLAEKLKSQHATSKSIIKDLTSNLGKIPSSLTVTKTSSKPFSVSQIRKTDKTAEKPKLIPSDEIIILDDD